MRRISTILLGAVAHSELATEIPSSSGTRRDWESYYANAYPCLDEPLEKLVQLIPDLTGLQPASDQ